MRRSMVFSANALSLLVSCGPSSPSPSGVTAPMTAAPPSSMSAPAASTPSVPAASPRSAHVDASGCPFRGIPRHVTFSYDADIAGVGAPLGRADVVENAVVVLGDRQGAPSSIAFDFLGLHFDALLPEGGVDLYAHAPLDLAGVYDPSSSVPLLWRLTSQGLVVEAAAAFGVKALVPLERAVACTDVLLEDKGFPSRAIPKAKYFASWKTPLRLSPAPGEPPAAELGATTSVAVVEERGSNVQIVYEASGLWHGWAARAGLVREKEAGGVGYGTGHGRGRGTKFPGGHICSEAMPLYARKVGTPSVLVVVGHLREGRRVALAPVEEADPFRKVLSEQRVDDTTPERLKLREGIELVVDRDRSAVCKAASNG